MLSHKLLRDLLKKVDSGNVMTIRSSESAAVIRFGNKALKSIEQAVQDLTAYAEMDPTLETIRNNLQAMLVAEVE